MTSYQLKRSIEAARKTMTETAAKYSLHHPDVVELSITLDRLLNEYESHKKSSGILIRQGIKKKNAAS